MARFGNLPTMFRTIDHLTSDDFLLKDGHSYYLVRLWISGAWAYCLHCTDDGARHTMLMSEGAMQIVLERRDGEISPAPVQEG